MAKCKYCNGSKGNSPSKALYGKTISLGCLGKTCCSVYIYDDAILDLSIGNYDMTLKIHYCPMCGRKLEES